MLLAHFTELFLSSAPWLLLGLVIAGLLKEFVPMTWMQKQLGDHGVKSTVKAALLGAPLPLCSCGVIPAAISLRRSGASKAATTSFLVSTPETGVDSVVLSYVLLGPFMAVVRPVSAVLSAITAGLLVGRDEQNRRYCGAKTTSSGELLGEINKLTPTESSCCTSSAAAESDKASCCSSSINTQTESGCCSEKTAVSTVQKQRVGKRMLKGVHFAATELMRDTTVWLLGGLFFAALIQTYVPADFMAAWGDGLLAMLVMVVISVPMYICATASTPIAAGLLLSGVSPGAILVFMLAGPATNIATLGVVANELGKRALISYLVGVLGVALIAGSIVNVLVERFDVMVMPQVHAHGELLPEAITYTTGVIIFVLMLKVIVDKLTQMIKRKIPAYS